MTPALIFAVVLLGAALAGAVAALRRRHPGALPAEVAAMRADVRTLAQRFACDASVLEQRLDGIDTRISESQVQSNDMARSIFATLGDVTRHTTTVAEQAREFSTLQDMLRAPQARGGLGEAMLEELLRQVLPPQAFGTQHRFSSGVVVDAVVRMGGRLVCIDSKFPLANHQRMCIATTQPERVTAARAFAADVDRHIKDIASRYIVPDEKTLDFAVMYVPAEGVYGEVLRLAHGTRPLFETAIAARVVPMSPLTLYGYLQTVAFGLKCLSIEKSAEMVLGFCSRMQQDLERFATEYDTLGRHLNNARSKHEEGIRRLDRFRDQLDRAADFSEEGGPAAVPALETVEGVTEAMGE